MADWPLKGYESAYLLVLQPLELHVNMKTETIKERKCFKKNKKKTLRSKQQKLYLLKTQRTKISLPSSLMLRKINIPYQNLFNASADQKTDSFTYTEWKIIK